MYKCLFIIIQHLLYLLLTLPAGPMQSYLGCNLRLETTALQEKYVNSNADHSRRQLIFFCVGLGPLKPCCLNLCCSASVCESFFIYFTWLSGDEDAVCSDKQ